MHLGVGMLSELAALRREVADLRALVSRLVAAGEVLEHDPAGQRVRVRLPGDDNLSTAWLPVLTPRARGTRQYSVPQVGEQVWCLFLPDGGLEAGAVIGASYNAQDATPAASADTYRLEFADGGHLTQDAASGALDLHAVGALTLSAASITLQAGTVTLAAPASHATGTLRVTGNVTGAEVSLADHVHPGVERGADRTDPPEAS